MASTALQQCTALNLSDEASCQEPATSTNGLFCAFHSKQVQGLYQGYKRRNADLDKLSKSPPQYLADSKTPLANQLYADVDSEEVCQDIHDHLFRKFQLLERVIRARKLHHIHFFSMNCDYGHAKYLDQLQTERAIVNKQLERIERRTAEILYEKRKWFKWVRQCQDDEEAHREKEQKKVRQEAALFKRHWKGIQQRKKDLRIKEKQKMQDALLERTYKARLAEREEEDNDDSIWDPIEDVLEDQRGKFIDLIKHFLWINEPEVNSSSQPSLDVIEAASIVPKDEIALDVCSEKLASGDCGSHLSNGADPGLQESLGSVKELEHPNMDSGNKPLGPVKSKSSNKKKTKAPAERRKARPSISASSDVPNPQNLNENGCLAVTKSSKTSKDKKKAAAQPPPHEFDKNLIETRDEMQQRLKIGSEYNLDEVVGVMMGGTVENPIINTKTITYPDEEIERLLFEISRIKLLLFCRLLLGHAALLPAALRADSVETFLNDPEVTEAALRDLCLKMERPGLQEIRDACADLFRNENEEMNNKANEDSHGHLGELNEDDIDSNIDLMLLKPEKPRGALPDKWLSKREKARNEMPDMPSFEDMLGSGGTTRVDFGEIKKDGIFHKKMVRVKVCGRTIWNYPSNKAMTRNGWLHFSIIAKDSSLYDAIALCRHWDEFYDLNILAVWHYFPGANWVTWVGNRARQQMLELGFIVYFETDQPDAMDLTRRHQTARGGPHRRSYSILEVRNFICAHIKRDDPISRRLIQYLHMQSHQLLMLVRDAETGQILVKPPEEERWLIREKSGFGRAVRGEWNIIKEVGPKLFEEMDAHRQWHFGFKEYYDIVVWDLSAGESFPGLYNAIQENLFKANRFRGGSDLYNPAAHILKTLTRDEENRHVRDLKPGDNTSLSIYDEIHDEKASFFYGKLPLANSPEIQQIPTQSDIPKNLFYTEADALEDEILFPEEHSSSAEQVLGIEKLRRWEEEGFSMMKFVDGWWSDSDDDTADEWDDEDSDEEDEVNSDDDGDNGHKEIDEGDVAMLKQTSGNSTGSLDASANLSPSLQHLMNRSMKDEFMEYFDKEKARIFKEVWHKADLEPQAQTHYIEMKEMAKKSRKFNERVTGNPNAASDLTYSLKKWLEAYGHDTTDLHKAVGKLTPFFYSDFLNSESGKIFKDSLLFNQQERAKDIPAIRSSVSNVRRPDSFWKEWDEAQTHMKYDSDMPAEWDIVVRPIIAHLYKSGVIRSRVGDTFCGKAIAAIDTISNTWDLFFDFRHSASAIIMPRSMQNPYNIPPFLTTARTFSITHPKARFAVLRLWSAPHFYPLSIGFDKTEPTSFQDMIGRTFNWMFVPKDMPYSEWSMHHSARQRIEPFAKHFGQKVIVKRNAFLVMGEDEEELRKLAIGTTYAIQRNPWRWEVDLWKSFINVDFKFLEGLKEGWLE